MENNKDFEFYAVPANSPFEVKKEHLEEFRKKEKEIVPKFQELMKKMEQEKNFDEEPTVFAVPCDRVFVVDKEKAEEFKSLKPNQELLKKIHDTVKKLNITIELEPMDYSGQILKKTRK